jgi:hypothetical protein
LASLLFNYCTYLANGAVKPKKITVAVSLLVGLSKISGQLATVDDPKNHQAAKEGGL